MSAILSADDLNDFISPGIACIKPIETIPKNAGDDGHNPYEVTTEDKVAAANPAPAQISLTDCLACSGCVTSAEAVLVSLQSHTEVLNTLDSHPSLRPTWAQGPGINGSHSGINGYANGAATGLEGGKIFVASVSPQTRASLAALYNISHEEAGNMIAHMLSGPQGLAAGGSYGSSFLWVADTNRLREAALVLAADEVASALSDPAAVATDDGSIDAKPKKPILTSACPGWICYAEKTHPYILPHLSRLKSPQALAGTMLKSVLSKRFGIPPSSIWHVAIMPCFDKKLEASRSELTSAIWTDLDEAVRDVDCVITARELLSMATARDIDFANLPRTPLPRKSRVPFPDPVIDRFLFPPGRRKTGRGANGDASAGTSGGYLWHIMQTHRARHLGSRIHVSRGRNADVVEYSLVREDPQGKVETLFCAARYYGFRNIQNLVRRLKPAGRSKLLAARGGGAAQMRGARRSTAATACEHDYVEVMACPGGCTNGGGQIRAGDVEQLVGSQPDPVVEAVKVGPREQRAWLAKVDEAYFSASSEGDGEEDIPNGHNDVTEMELDEPALSTDLADPDIVDGVSRRHIHQVLDHWSSVTGVNAARLVFTSYRKVESDVGKKASDIERVAGLASSIGGGW